MLIMKHIFIFNLGSKWVHFGRGRSQINPSSFSGDRGGVGWIGFKTMYNQ